jgi:hypothetical protein
MMKIPGEERELVPVERSRGVVEGRRATPTIVSPETEIPIFNLATDRLN